MPTTVVGLDLGRTAVRAVEVRRSGRLGTVRRQASVALPPGAVAGGLVVEPEPVTLALRRLWKEGGFSTRRVHLGVCSGSVLVRPIELDWMPADDVRRALRYQVADHLPVAVEDANLDHVLLGEVERADPAGGAARRMLRVLLVATARGAVDQAVRAVHAAGLTPVAADLTPLALVRAAASAPTDATPVCEAVVDVGADTVAVAVHTGGVPHFVRVMPGLGGDTVLDAVRAARGCDPATAARALAEAPAAADVIEALARLVAEVRATVDFHAALVPTETPARLRLAGALATHPALTTALAAALGVPVGPLALDALVEGGRGAQVLLDPAMVVPASLCVEVPA